MVKQNTALGPQVQLSESWKNLLIGEFHSDYMRDLRAFLAKETAAGKVLYPRGGDVFAALNATSFEDVRVVLLGQDPYHGPGQAHGLSFSVHKGVRIPPSLRNIYMELKADLGLDIPSHGCLDFWTKQGVLLLNSVLTVEQSRPGSHQNMGWERFTDRIIQLLSEKRENLVFLLWGSYAQKKGQVIDSKRHRVLKAAHPSPFSAHRGFLGCRHFSQTNQFLKSKNEQPIDWRVEA